jgi:Spy/CpxP family protein refolding chaperone
MAYKKILVTVSVLTLTLAATAAYAGGWGGGRGYGRFGGGAGPGFQGRMVARMAETLQLTEQQQAAIKQIHEEAGKDAEPLIRKVRELREKMRAEWRSEAPDKGTLMDLHDEIHRINGELGESRIQTRLDVLNVLTPEQRATWKANMGKRLRDGRGRGFKGMGPGRGQGRNRQP